jgi:hypothetical protein
LEIIHFQLKDNYVLFEGMGKKELVLRECVQGFIPKQLYTPILVILIFKTGLKIAVLHFWVLFFKNKT